MPLTASHLFLKNMRGIVILSVIAFINLFSLCTSFGVAPLNSYRRSSTVVKMTLLNYKGKKVEIKEGTPLSQACVKLGLKPTYSCKK